MGTRGYIVYRYKKLFFYLYNHWDSYPEGLGLQLLHEIPRGQEAFKEWLQDKRDELDAILDEKKRDAQLSDDATEDEVREAVRMHPNGSGAYDGFDVTTVQPRNDIMIEWVYEMDLDRLVFHVDCMPLFRLDNMPPEEFFVKGIGFDNYGNRACSEGTPEEYRYRWKASPRPVEKSVLDNYATLTGGLSPISSVHELLAMPATLAHRERVRVRMLEIQIGSTMMAWEEAHDLRELETYHHADEFSHLPIAQVMKDIVVRAIWPAVFDNKRSPIDTDSIGNWIRKDLYLLLAAHLDDPDSLRAAAVDVSQKIMLETPDSGGVVYGLLFSALHCAIVRVDRDRGGVFTHTAALPFLPSWYATSPSTEGITALGRLAYLPDPDILTRFAPSEGSVPIIDEKHAGASHNPFFADGGLLDNLPEEIIAKIAACINDPITLYIFAKLSPCTIGGSADALRRVYVREWPLVNIAANEGNLPPRSRLVNGIFTTVSDVNPHPVELWIGQQCRRYKAMIDLKTIAAGAAKGCATADELEFFVTPDVEWDAEDAEESSDEDSD